MACQCKGTEHAVDCASFDVWSDFQKYTAPAAADPVGEALGIVPAGLVKVSCFHLLDPFTLRDGTIIRASSSYTRKCRTHDPDVAFYLDPTWIPSDIFCYAIGWQDYGLPYVSDRDLLRYARAALQHARNGEAVEVACIGGHGRTGTFLAILDLLASDRPNPKRSIWSVRDAYCSKAIETREQEWFVHAVGAMLTGSEVPPMPRRKVALKRASGVVSSKKTKGGGKRKKT